ncbi:hypothetical protein BDF21DRAFT_377022 [Thamnidium elegans]|uniref:Uncharacterized protein n=1 Tax=Thamnidium elegans TaxID=101142 RepID=A0A8H7VUZ6_9FUNG|nr:hypothetical protein INT48_007889 [Thamnidium elegans]KAI8092001.1 hypothetical protein BDF21DRAFT_377022 [Thamnidium elegans]
MADLNWCTSCDNAVSPFSESLYCSEQCLRADALRNHPLLGYTYPEFTDFPRPKPRLQQQHHHQHHSSSYSNYSSVSNSPALTATSSHSDASSIRLSSPPKFDLLPSNNKMANINYFSLFSGNSTGI